MNKYIEAEKLKAEIRKLLIPTVVDRDYDEWERGRDAGLQQAIDIVESLQQVQPEVEWKDGFHSHSIKARVYPCLDKNTVRVESDERLEKNEYLYPGRNVRMVILLDNKDNTLNARNEE